MFVIMGWWLDEVDGYKPDDQTRFDALLDEVGWRAVPVVGMVMAWRWIAGKKS